MSFRHDIMEPLQIASRIRIEKVKCQVVDQLDTIGVC